MSEIESRGKEVYDLFKLGHRSSDIFVFFKKKYGVGDEAIQSYIDHSKEIAKRDFDWSPEDAKFNLVSNYMQLYELNIQTGKYADARNILQDIATLYPVKTTKIDVTTNGESLNEQRKLISKLSIEDLERIDNIIRSIETDEESS